MLLTFWVHGRGRNDPEPLHWAKSSWHGVLSAVDEVARWIGIIGLGESIYESRTTSEEPEVDRSASKEPSAGHRTDEKDSKEGWLSSKLGGFGLTGLRSPVGRGEKAASTARIPPPGTYKVGEVHGDYVKVSDNHVCLIVE